MVEWKLYNCMEYEVWALAEFMYYENEIGLTDLLLSSTMTQECMQLLMYTSEMMVLQLSQKVKALQTWNKGF